MNESKRTGTRHRAPAWLTGAALPPPPSPATEPRDLPPTWDGAARAAVAAALAASDVCLISGGAGDTRAALAAEIAARLPGRLLLLAPDPSAWHGRIRRRCSHCAQSPPPPSSWLSRLLQGLGLGRGCPPACAHVPTTIAPVAGAPDLDADWLIVVEAQMIEPAVLASAAARAPRCVLIGSGTASHFADLVRRLSFDPWVREDGRIVCRLRPVANRQRLAVEAVADQPDIELRIVADTDGSSDLAEVAFPRRIGIVEAKSYIRQQLGDAPLCLPADGGTWRTTAEAIEARFSESPNASQIEAAPDDGVIESIAETEGGWSLAELRFDHAAGWTEAAAAEWFRRAADRHGQGRIVRLPRRVEGPVPVGVV